MSINCTYLLKDNFKHPVTLTGLTEYYYKNTSELKNTKIFSSDEIVNSIVDKIKDQFPRGKTISMDPSKMDISQFITTRQEEFLGTLGISKQRLAPEYIEENRILSEVKRKLISDGVNPHIDWSLKELISQYADNPDISNKIIQYTKDIQDVIEIEKGLRDFGIGLHSILSSLKFSQGEFNISVEQNIDDLIEKNKWHLGGESQDWKDKIKDVLYKIYSTLNSKGTILTNVILDTIDGGAIGLKGKLDFVVVDEDGNVHIFELKLSKRDYPDWDSTKKLTTDWELALQRQLLAQHINAKNIISINVIPISIGERSTLNKFNPINFSAGKIVSLSAANTGLQSTGTITRTAQLIIPEKFNIEYDTKKNDRFLADLAFLFPLYKIKTSKDENDPEKIIADAIKNNKLEFISKIDDFELGLIKDENFRFRAPGLSDAEKLVKFKERVYAYTKKLSENNYYRVTQLKDKISEAILNKSDLPLKMANDHQTLHVNALLSPYLNGDYKVVENNMALDSLGFILLKSKRSNKLVLFSLTVLNGDAKYDKNTTFAEVEYLKMLLFFHHYYDELDLDFNKIKNLIPLNVEGSQARYFDVNKIQKQYFDLLTSKGITPKINLSNFLNLTDRAVTEMQEAVLNLESTSVEKIVLKYGEDYQGMELYKLKQIHRELADAFPELKKKTFGSEIDFKNRLEYVFAILSSLIVAKSGDVPEGDFMQMRNFAIGFSDFKSLLAAFYSDEQADYDKTGRRILGIIGGLKTNTPDRIGSVDLQNINKMITGANSSIRHKMYKQSTTIAAFTYEFFKKINYSNLSQNWIGNVRSLNKNMWEHDGSEVSNSWSLKDPYSDKTLTQAEQEYSKQMLFEIKKYRLHIPEKLWGKIDLTSIESITKTDTSGIIIKSIISGDYFKMPIMRSQQINRNDRILKSGLAGLWQDVSKWLDETKDYLDPREFSENDLNRIKETQLGFNEMYDIYSMQSDEMKVRLINENSPGYYELDLDTIAHRVAFSSIRKANVDAILPNITSYVWWMKLLAGKNKENISKQLEYITNRIKLGLFDEPIIDPEASDAIRLVRSGKTIATAAMLGFRPALMAKELTFGLYKNVGLAALNIYGGKKPFNIKDLAEAMKIMLAVDNKMSKKWNLMDGINLYYGFANMDVNSLPRKMQTNRRGAMLGLSKWMYACNTIPDYYNRLSLFIAKMIHDGSFYAHTLDDKGYIHYDPTQDKRFEYYFQNREKYKNADGQYIPAKNNLKYNEQRNLYTIILGERNTELAKGNNPILDEATDLLDQAYSEKERTGFKSFTDTVYGYYDKDSQAEWHNTWYGIIWLQLLQFWPGKMNMWFGKPVSADKSMMGSHQQVTDEETGQLLWREPVYSQTNPDEIIGFKATTENTGDPMLAWVGHPQEGLLYSVGYLMQDVIKGNWGEIAKNKDHRNERVGFAMVDSLLMVLLFGMMKAIYDGWIAENGTDGIDGRTVEFMASVNKKVLSEGNLWNNTLGALKTEPVFWAWGTKTATDVHSVLWGNKTFEQLMNKDLKMFEFMHPSE